MAAYLISLHKKNKQPTHDSPEQLLLANKKQDACLDIIADTIFWEKKPPQSSAGRQSAAGIITAPTLTITQEFQLVIVLCDFFTERRAHNNPQSASICNALFLSLFGHGIGIGGPARARVLCRLVSTAISARQPDVLSAAGTWMQQMGPSSPCCTELAARLVDDFVHYSPPTGRPHEQLLELPLLAPRFTVNLITAITELYLLDATHRTAPPAILLEVLFSWMAAAPQLCLGGLPAPALPVGAIAMPLVTPLAGLIRWCVLSPMLTASAAPNHNAANAGGGATMTTNTTAAATEPQVDPKAYSKLHLAVLQSLAQNQSANAAAAASGPLPGINALHLSAIVTALKQVPVAMHDVDGTAAAADSDATTAERLQECLERFAQSVQLAMAARAITGNVTQLMCRLETLPRNPLLQIVIRANK